MAGHRIETELLQVIANQGIESISRHIDLLPLTHDVDCCSFITVVINIVMTIAYSKLTAQGQISVPAEVRRRLGLGPGSVLEWDEEDDKIVLRRAGRYTSEDVHRALFPKPPQPQTLVELKDGVRQYMKGRYARR